MSGQSTCENRHTCKENNDSGCFVSLFHNDGSQTAPYRCGEFSEPWPRAVRLEQCRVAEHQSALIDSSVNHVHSGVFKNGTGGPLFPLCSHTGNTPQLHQRTAAVPFSHDSTLYTCGYSLPRHANWSQLCGCGWGVHGWLEGCRSLRACVWVWKEVGWGCHVCILRMAVVFVFDYPP